MTVSGTNEKKDRAYIDFTINGETSNLTLSFTKLVSVQKIMVMLYNKGEIEMQRINEKYQYKTTPISNSEAIISGENYRFTVLTDRLMRLEYSHDEKFEDRATQTVVNRKFEVPEFSNRKKWEYKNMYREYGAYISWRRIFKKQSFSEICRC